MKMIFFTRSLSLLVAILFVSISICQAKVVGYPSNNSDADLPLSNIYLVQIMQNEKLYETTTYMSISNGNVEGARNQAVYNSTISWAQFSFDEEVTIRVTLLPGQNKVSYPSASILPKRHGISPVRINDNTLEFTITKPGQYSVEFGSTGFNNGLMIFADPLETIPAPTGSGVKICNPCQASDLANLSAFNAVVFTDAIHNIGMWQIPGNIKNIYLQGGAVVKGTMDLNSSANNNTRIYGRGILNGGRGKLNGSNVGDTKEHGIEGNTSVSGVTLDGLVVAQAGAFFVRLLGKNNSMNWIKTIGGWRFNNDGLVGYENTRITNCFVWANDDGIKLYRDNQIIDNIVAWHLCNGGVFQWCWSTVSAKNIRVSNVDVIHGLWPSDGANQGVFNIRASEVNSSGVQLQQDWIFENINVDNPVAVLFNLAPQVAHRVDKVTFRNINAQVTSNVINRVKGHSTTNKISNVTFDGLFINGQCVNDGNKSSLARFSISNADNVVFTGNCQLTSSTRSIKKKDSLSFNYSAEAKTLSFDAIHQGQHVKLIALDGKVRYQGQLTGSKEIALSGLARGIYLISVQGYTAVKLAVF